eukprot:2290017-Rhodomonas_salina.1
MPHIMELKPNQPRFRCNACQACGPWDGGRLSSVSEGDGRGSWVGGNAQLRRAWPRLPERWGRGPRARASQATRPASGVHIEQHMCATECVGEG